MLRILRRIKYVFLAHIKLAEIKHNLYHFYPIMFESVLLIIEDQVEENFTPNDDGV